MSENERAQLAAQFVNSTAQNIFLTGKAGTGKTTFLRELALHTHKSFVIVAPTGIAALNAKGVTIHSQFLLPFGGFIPERNPSGHYTSDQKIFTQHSLARRHPLNAARRQVLRNIDLLIIDEVSMLRADVLDAIDYRLRSVKRNFHQAFGGVQVLMIGDLYQLPPIVRPEEWNLLRSFYPSMLFFDSQALRKSGFVSIELNKIYRQEDPVFVSILNNLRTNTASMQDIDALNQHLHKKAPEEDIITLTTHNRQAESINQKALEELKGSADFYPARIEGDFPESSFPVPENIALKRGAQVMFVKNDSQEGRYYNGKLGRIVDLSEDEITVESDGDRLSIQQEKWENKKYTIDPESKELNEEVIGTYHQYPIKLAWAITVHKSQGLTFDQAIVDVGRAFAPGQVYVALSRLRSLDGLYLKTPISPQVVSSDARVVEFNSRMNAQESLENLLDRGQSEYLIRLVAKAYQFQVIEDLCSSLKQEKAYEAFKDEELKGFVPDLHDQIEGLRSYSGTFIQQLQRFIHQGDDRSLGERIQKGSDYYTEFLKQRLYTLQVHLQYVRQMTKVKAYVTALEEVDQAIMVKWGELDEVGPICRQIIDGREVETDPDLQRARLDQRKELLIRAINHAEENPKAIKGARKRKKNATTEKGATFKTTYALLKEGMTMNEVAISRELTTSTIERHAAKGVLEGELPVEAVLPEKDRKELELHASQLTENELSVVYHKLKGRYSYGSLRIMKAHLDRGSTQ